MLSDGYFYICSELTVVSKWLIQWKLTQPWSEVEFIYFLLYKTSMISKIRPVYSSNKSFYPIPTLHFESFNKNSGWRMTLVLDFFWVVVLKLRQIPSLTVIFLSVDMNQQIHFHLEIRICKLIIKLCCHVLLSSL